MSTFTIPKSALKHATTMHPVPSSSTALDSIDLDGDRPLQRGPTQEQDDPVVAKDWASEVHVQLTRAVEALSQAADSDTKSQLLSINIPFNLDNLDKLKSLPPKAKPKPAQCIFLCMRGHDGEHFAVQMTCYRPRVKRRRVWTRVNLATGTERSEYRLIKPEEAVCESDSIIYDRLREGCYEHQGKWKRWIPFYGIVDVREVKIRFTSARVTTPRLPVKVRPLDIEALRRDDEATIAIRDDEYHYDSLVDVKGSEGAAEEIHQARVHMGYLEDLHLLKDYMRNPWSATAHFESRSTLEGLAQESPILEK